MRLLAPLSAIAILLVVGGCPAPEQPATREPVRPTTPTEPVRPMEPTTPTVPAVSDQQIEQQLRDRIQQDQAISSTVRQSVMIEVRNGIVTLRGEVDSQSESQRIEDMALQLQGVQDVNNLLRIADAMLEEPDEPIDDPAGDPDDPYDDPA